MGLVPARRPGWLLEGRGNPSPRGMAAQSPRDCGDGQNPAYRPSGVFLPCVCRGGGPHQMLVEGPLRSQWRGDFSKWSGMAKQKRSDDWGFPALALLRRQGPRGRASAPVRPRRVQRNRRQAGAQSAAQPRALVFLRGARRRIQQELELFRRTSAPKKRRSARRRRRRDASGFRKSAHWQWGGPGDGSRSRDEMRALDALELESDADFKAIKAAHRRLVKETHPDANPGDAEAAKRFKQVQAAYDVLRRAEERKNAQNRPKPRPRIAPPSASRARSCWARLGCGWRSDACGVRTGPALL